MTKLFDKLNLKDLREILVVNAPEDHSGFDQLRSDARRRDGYGG